MSVSLESPRPPDPASHAAARPLLPVHLTSFVGREREIDTVSALLGSSRLLTLTGAGGSGKTRLAGEVASRAAEGVEDVGWVELAPLAQAGLLPQFVATALGLGEERPDSAVRTILAFLANRPFLLVLDNCEHLVEACAVLTEMLLRACPELRVLATGREPLGVPGERAWLVPGLSLPGAEAEGRAADVEDAEAVRLFVERARDAVPGFALSDANAAAVAQVCRRLDGIPLAIELAAARAKVLAPEQIARRLDDVFALLASGARTVLPRHRTLRAVIDWSYEMLSEEERLLLQRLSVFAGGFSLEAAERVCADGRIARAEVLELLAMLVDRSLVTMQEVEEVARYRLLETVRQYGAERLRAAGEEEALQDRHLAFFLDLAGEAEPHLTTPRRRRWVELLDRELDNLRQALRWSRESDPEAHLRLAGMLCWYWFSSRHWAEGRQWLDRALTLPGAAGTPSRAAALFAAGVLATLQGQSALATPWLRESAAIADALGDRRQEAYARNYLGMSLVVQGLPEGKAPVAAALAWFREAGDLYGLRLSMLILGSLALAQGRTAEAAELAGEGVRVARSFGQNRELGIALQTLGEVHHRQGDLAGAAALFLEALEALRNDPLYLFVARSLELLAVVACDQGNVRDSARLFGSADSIREALGAAVFKLDDDRYQPRIAAARAALGEAAFAEARAEGRAATFPSVISLARAAVEHTPAPPPAPGGEPPSGAERQPGGAPGLRVRALGPLEIARAGEPLGAESWAAAKPRELLLFLLTRPEGRTREQIALALWPDASPAQAKNRFHVALHHLRRALGGAESVVFAEDRYRVDPGLGAELDATVFERRIRAALAAGRAGGEAEEALGAALALYRGDFLEYEPTAGWHLELRDHLRALYVAGLSALGERLMDAGRTAEAAEVFRRLVLKEDLHEEGCRNLMVCTARLGDRTAALRLYERLVAVLERELGAEPEPETVALQERICRAEPV
jgi:predicted ATPase/DNA-binding SARP family transcriptional activator